MSPTGTAARNIKGVTFHSAFMLPVQHGREPDYVKNLSRTLKKIRQKFEHVHTVIIDEISMVSAKMLVYIHKRLCEIKNNDLYFGGLNMIAVGDFLQLRPVRGFFAFEHKLLWHNFKPFFLTGNMRQQENSTYISLLNRARVGLLTKSDISLLSSRLMKKIPYDIGTVIHLFPKNKDVDKHNSLMQKRLPTRAIRVNAVHYYSNLDVHPSSDVDAKDIPKDDRDAGGLPACLVVSKGTRIMLIRNIYTSHGLVNGAMGYVDRFEFAVDDPLLLQYINVKFDDPEVGRVFQDSTCAIPIERISQEFYYNGRVIIREQFPLQPCWACTIHKVQGASLKRAVISIGEDVFERGMAYVALSRVCSLQGLFLKSFSPAKVTAQPKALDEYERLHKLAKKDTEKKNAKKGN